MPRINNNPDVYNTTVLHTLYLLNVSGKKRRIITNKCKQSQILCEKIYHILPAGLEVIEIALYGLSPSELRSKTYTQLCARIDLAHTIFTLERMPCQE